MKNNQIITICSCEFRLILTPGNRKGWPEQYHMGRSSICEGNITVDSDMGHSARCNTLLHEVIHIIANITDLPKNSFSEVHISTIASLILDFLVRNKKLALELIYGVLKNESNEITKKRKLKK